MNYLLVLIITAGYMPTNMTFPVEPSSAAIAVEKVKVLSESRCHKLGKEWVSTPIATQIPTTRSYICLDIPG